MGRTYPEDVLIHTKGKKVFVYQEADVMFNSTLVYELCVLKSTLEEIR